MLASATSILGQGGSDHPPGVTNPNAGEKLGFFRSPYQGRAVNSVDDRNSSRIYDLVRAGNLYLSLSDAIALAIENNLDAAAARYQIPIANTDLMRSKGGGT